MADPKTRWENEKYFVITYGEAFPDGRWKNTNGGRRKTIVRLRRRLYIDTRVRVVVGLISAYVELTGGPWGKRVFSERIAV